MSISFYKSLFGHITDTLKFWSSQFWQHIALTIGQHTRSRTSMARKVMWPVLHKAMRTEASQVTGAAFTLDDIQTPVIHPLCTLFHLFILQHALGPQDHQNMQFNTATHTVWILNLSWCPMTGPSGSAFLSISVNLNWWVTRVWSDGARGGKKLKIFLVN